jgi:hypothetical protein
VLLFEYIQQKHVTQRGCGAEFEGQHLLLDVSFWAFFSGRARCAADAGCPALKYEYRGRRVEASAVGLAALSAASLRLNHPRYTPQQKIHLVRSIVSVYFSAKIHSNLSFESVGFVSCVALPQSSPVHPSTQFYIETLVIYQLSERTITPQNNLHE